MIEQRRTKRFELSLPVEVVRTGANRVSQVGHTRNISSGGVLFTSANRMEIGGPVEYVITLSSGHSGDVNLRCMGKVLRIQQGEDEIAEPFVVAASLERYEFLRSRSFF